MVVGVARADAGDSGSDRAANVLEPLSQPIAPWKRVVTIPKVDRDPIFDTISINHPIFTTLSPDNKWY